MKRGRAFHADLRGLREGKYRRLMESQKLGGFVATFPAPGSNEVEKVRRAEPRRDVPARGYVNRTQYPEGVPQDVWDLHIGGCEARRKWLKDRRGRKLTCDDLTHCQKVVVALKETIRLMEKIDKAIPSRPIRQAKAHPRG